MTSIASEKPATKASRGAGATFTDLFGRYFAELYDFALRLARDQEIAALAVQEGYLAAWTAIQESEAPEPFKQVLFANAHNSLASYLRKRKARVATAANEPFAALNESEWPDPALAQNLAAVAWQCAAELRLDDYELLDLRLRRRWDPAEMAAMLQARLDLVERRLARVRADFEGAFSARLLLSSQRSCLDLDVLAGDEPWSPGLRRRVAHHLSVCPTCEATRLHYPPGSDVIGALALVQAPSGWEDAILARLQEAVRSSGTTGRLVLPAEPAGGRREPGSGETPIVATGPTKRSAGRAGRPPPGAVMLLSGGFLVLALFVGGMCATGAFNAGSSAPASHNVTTAKTGVAAPTATATITAAPPTATPTLAPPPTAAPPHKKGKPG